MKIFTWKQRGIVWGTTLCTIVVMCGIGYGIDFLASTGKLFFVIGLLGSFPVNAYFIKRNVLTYGIDPSIRPTQK